MSHALAGRTALVTGSVAGLGYAIACGLAAEGANVVVNGLCDGDEGEAAAERLAAEHGVEAAFDPADLTEFAQIEAMAKRAEARFGGVDILVNNAVVRNFAAIEDMEPAAWNMSLAVNVTAPFLLLRLLLPGMKARGWGRAINLCSVYSQRAAAGRADYVTTKTALLGLTRAAAAETAGSGVTVNALAPGTVPTPAIMGKLEAIAASDGRPLQDVERDYIAERHPTGRFIAMESVAATAAFLCGPAGDDITGALFPLDGGWTAV